ncbi:MAG: formylglycine-generating enzyme family protein [Magnetococcales bacterium]|nr:SUMF1/EgtB/PvdO family nonheme iron enzyme [Magnetococcales bacterium]NGZ28401.1 formylglycine-generating enzyme family protein [Magnetococcales bacterium]
MITSAGLDGLLHALRLAGLTIGVGEVARLHQVFQHLPDGVRDQHHLSSLLQSLLVKNQAEREIFQRTFQAWQEQVNFDLEQAGQQEFKGNRPVWLPTGSYSRRRFRLFRPGYLLVFIFFLGVVIDLYFHDYFFNEPSPVQTILEQQVYEPLQKKRELREKFKNCPTPPEIINTYKDTRIQPGPHLVLAILALMVAGRLWRKLRYRHVLPPATDQKEEETPRHSIPFTPSPEELLLTREDREVLVWGIGRFITGELSRKLDVKKTVEDTARAGGLPHLHFQQLHHHHEVWLWLDQSVDNHHLAKLAEELRETLTVHGLTVEVAWFHGVPDRLATPEGELFAPREIEERRDTALVAILTDGRLLSMRQNLLHGRLKLESLLRDLSHWPSLWFVDFSEGRSGLAPLLASHELSLLSPRHLAQRLGGVVPQEEANLSPEDRQFRLWAAAAALSPLPVDEGTLHGMREAMGLTLSPWSIAFLRQQAPGPGSLLHWRGEQRVALLNWLLECEEGHASLDKAVEFWQRHFNNDQTLENHLLKMWSEREKAIPFLYERCRGALADVIKHHLSQMTFRHGSRQRIRLPWQATDLSALEQRMLQEMTFDGGQFRVRVAPSGRLWLALWLLAGLSLGAILTSPLRINPVCQPVEEVDPKTGITFIQLCPGSFIMGSNDYPNEQCPHKVTLSAFDLAKFEVTNEQYRQFKTDHTFPEEKKNWPVTDVTWHDANAFCQHFGYQLPSEAQWEYAARTGTTSQWSFGDNESLLGEYAWYNENSGIDTHPRIDTHPIGQKKSNPWGFHDMHGNVWEWIADWYEESYKAADREDPTGPPSGEYRSLRGGSFADSPQFLRSAFRSGGRPEGRGRGIGVRCGRFPSRQHGLTP